MFCENRTQSWLLSILVVVLALVWVDCKPPVQSPVPDAGDQGPCPAGYYFVPAGSFEMGIHPDDDLHGLSISLFWDLMPRRTVIVSDFCIQKTEASVGAYRSCVEAGTCDGLFQNRDWTPRCNYSEELDDRDDHPMNCVSWAAARTYCQLWEGGDLPSDAQWEKAARGTDRRLFPWGNEMITCDRANWDENGPYNEEGGGEGSGCNHSNDPATWPVGSLDHKGDSPYGLKDMSGNVSEWVLDCFDPGLTATCDDAPCQDPVNACDEGSRTTRGGSAEGTKVGMFSTVAHGHHAEIHALQTDLGFRCVVIPPASRRF